MKIRSHRKSRRQTANELWYMLIPTRYTSRHSGFLQKQKTQVQWVPTNILFRQFPELTVVGNRARNIFYLFPKYGVFEEHLSHVQLSGVTKVSVRC